MRPAKLPFRVGAIAVVGFVVAPVIAGLDKFAGLLADWDAYLAPPVARMLGGAAHGFMLAVGVIEVVAGLIVAVRPRIGAYVVAAWLAGIIINLLMTGRYFVERILPDTGAHLAKLKTGADVLMAMPAEAF